MYSSVHVATLAICLMARLREPYSVFGILQDFTANGFRHTGPAFFGPYVPV